MVPDSDAELIARCRDGDEDAWRRLVDRHADLVFRIARRCDLNEASASDLVQEVFLALLRALPRLRRLDRLPGWLAQTARRAAWRERRRMRRGADREAEVARDELDEDMPPAEALAEIEAMHQVRQAYGAIGERCRRLLDLLFVDAHRPSYEEIASRLGLAVGSIGPTRRRCLEELEQALRALGFVGEA